MLLFRSEEEISAWCEQKGEPRGEALRLGQVWELTQDWYADQLSPDFRGRSAAEVAAIFANHGLTSAFWQ